MVAESDREGLMRLEKCALEPGIFQIFNHLFIPKSSRNNPLQNHNTKFKFGNLWFTIIYKGLFFLVSVSLATVAFFCWWSFTLEFDRRVQGLGHNLIRKILIEAAQHNAMERNGAF